MRAEEKTKKKNKNTEKSENIIIRRATALLLILLVFGFGGAIVRIGYFSLVMGEELQKKAYSQQLTDTAISAKRGTIYDTNGNTLAQSATVWQVVLTPRNFTSDEQREFVSQELAEILSVDQSEVYKKTQGNTYFASVKRKVETAEKDKVLELCNQIEKNYGSISLVSLIEDYKRYYPYGDFASAIIGFTGSDGAGLEGIEYQYDSYLTGTPGRIVTARNARGTEMPFKYEQKVDAQDGNNLVLTIDEKIQHTMEKYVKQGIVNNKVINRAVAVMMEVETGAILGCAVEDGYDLNDPFTVASKTVQQEIDKLPETQKEQAESEALAKQWRNKAVADTYYPGSVWKVITSCMGWSEGTITDQSTYTCTGSYVPFEGAGAIGCHKTSGAPRPPTERAP